MAVEVGVGTLMIVPISAMALLDFRVAAWDALRTALKAAVHPQILIWSRENHLLYILIATAGVSNLVISWEVINWL